MTKDFDDDLPDSLDDQLDQLIDKAMHSPENSLEQKRILRTILNSVALRGRLFDRVIEEPNGAKRSKQKQRFIWVMQQSGSIWMPRWIFDCSSVEDRADIESEAWLWFCKNFEKYVPEKASPVIWFNQRLSGIAKDWYRKNRGSELPPASLDQPVKSDDSESKTLGELQPSPDPDPESFAENELLRSRVQACLEKPTFIQTYVSEDCKDLHCRWLISAFLLDEMEWEEIFRDCKASQNKKRQKAIRRCYRERCLPRLRACLDAE
ncbi:MAG: hypothetical protein MUF72_19170 [Elainella sp. Prado103]|jgi:hypothetical protein|nr:hypothetical protein [Elainella sp. Prado103]